MSELPLDFSILSLLVIPMLGGVGLALAGGVLGCFIVWRHMAYFGDTLAHASLLGVSLGTIFAINPTLGVLGVCVLVAFLMAMSQRQKKLADDTILGILSHSALSLGLIMLATHPIPGRSLHNLLLGDLVTLSWTNVTTIFFYSFCLLALVGISWRALTSWVIDEDLAIVEGHPVHLLRLGLMLAIALFIALSMQFVGVLLITALLIAPAASARLVSKSPEQMALNAVLFAIAATLLGTIAAGIFDWPLGPSIVLLTSINFGITSLLSKNKKS